MKKFIIFSQSVRGSRLGAERCATSARRNGEGQDIFYVRSIEPRGLKRWARRSGVTLRYRGWSKSSTDFDEMATPASRLANGATHYELYLRISKMDEPAVVLEHDAIFVGSLPTVIPDKAIVQISSGIHDQLTPQVLLGSRRAQRAMAFEKNFHYNKDWNAEYGLIDHPLPGTNGTSGYIISPHTASELAQYIRRTGVGFADRLRKANMKESQLLLQNPQSVICPHDIKSTDSGLNQQPFSLTDVSSIRCVAG